MKDSIINFGESLPVKDLDRAYEHTRKADLCICLGSSLTVSPANEIPEIVGARKKNLVIVNLQKTPLHSKCSLAIAMSLAIHAMCDDVMKGVMQRLRLPIKKWYLERRLRIGWEQQREDTIIKIIGLDPTRDLTYSIVQKVVFKHRIKSTGSVIETVATKQPIVQ